MKKNIKFLPIALSLLVIVSFFTAVPFEVLAVAFNGRCGENAFYEFNEATNTLTISGSGDMYDYDNSAAPFSSKDMKYKYVVIEDGITSIGNLAFYNRKEILSVIIPDSVESIGGGAFYYCSNLSEITIPDSVKEIGALAFYSCSDLTSVAIGSGVSNIEVGAFADCFNLKDVFYKGSEEEWKSIDIKEENIWLSEADIHFFTLDNSAFLAAIEEASAYTKAHYTKETIEALNAVTEKYAYLINEEAAQSVYDNATAEIINAIRNLDALSNYKVIAVYGTTVILSKYGLITTMNFDEYTNQFCQTLDVVEDGIVNAKDFAYLLKNYSEES